MITPASLLTPGFNKYTPIGVAHDKDHLRRDYRFNLALAERFWNNWISFYLPWLQERNKWRERATNLEPSQFFMVSDHGDFSNEGIYMLGRISKVFPDMSREKPNVGRVKLNASVFDDTSGTYKIKSIFKDISFIAPIDWGSSEN